MNIYYEPEKYGYETVGEIDTAGSYEFDTFAVLKDVKANRFFYIHDSGCSCPTPFEGQGVADLTRVTSVKHLRELIAKEWPDDGYRHPGQDEIARLVELCRAKGLK